MGLPYYSKRYTKIDAGSYNEPFQYMMMVMMVVVVLVMMMKYNSIYHRRF